MKTQPSETNSRKMMALALATGSLLAAVAPAQAQAQLTPDFQAFPSSRFSSSLKNKIKHVIIIYPENRSFDSLYGSFPGANGLANATNYTQYTAPTTLRFPICPSRI